MMEHRIIAVWLLLASLVLTGCSPTPIYEQTYSIDQGIWSYNDSLSYEIDIVDAAQAYDLILHLTHDEAFASENLYIKISTTFADNKQARQILSLQLADISSSWVGSCAGERCTADIPLAEGRKFEQIGKHKITIAQYSRQEDLEGIYAVGISVIPVP